MIYVSRKSSRCSSSLSFLFVFCLFFLQSRTEQKHVLIELPVIMLQASRADERRQNIDSSKRGQKDQTIGLAFMFRFFDFKGFFFFSYSLWFFFVDFFHLSLDHFYCFFFSIPWFFVFIFSYTFLDLCIWYHIPFDAI